MEKDWRFDHLYHNARTKQNKIQKAQKYKQA